jgi:hypothetical protein
LAFILFPLILLLTSCLSSRPATYDTQSPPLFTQRELSLVFERESNYAPLSGKKVKIRISSPAELILPASGEATTDAKGAVRVLYKPVSRYDESALAAGDLIVDYPAILYVTMSLSPYQNYEWQVDDSQSFASYGDPLYRGLDREPDAGPFYINLFLP